MTPCTSVPPSSKINGCSRYTRYPADSSDMAAAAVRILSLSHSAVSAGYVAVSRAHSPSNGLPKSICSMTRWYAVPVSAARSASVPAPS